MLRKQFTKALLTCCVVLTISLCSIISASAYWNGGNKVVSNNGAEATIETANNYVAPGSSTSAWSMTCSAYGYAQVGYIKLVTSWTAPKYFYEYCYESMWYRYIIGTATIGSHNVYTVGCDSTTMYFKINGISYGSVPLSTIPFPRSEIQISGETHETADQCPGTVSNPVTFGGVKYKNTSNTWVSTTCYAFSGFNTLPTMANNMSPSGSSIWEIWDTRY